MENCDILSAREKYDDWQNVWTKTIFERRTNCLLFNRCLQTYINPTFLQLHSVYSESISWAKLFQCWVVDHPCRNTSEQWRQNEFETGGTGLEWKWRGAPIRRKVPENFFGRAPPLFGSKSTIRRFGERFCDGHYSLVSFLFAVLLLTVPRCPAICKCGGTCPLCPCFRGNSGNSLFVK